MKGNLFVLGVVRFLNGGGIALASCAYNEQVVQMDASVVRQVLEQPNMQMTVGKHYSFALDRVAWHLIANDEQLVLLLICKEDYPGRVAHACLEELSRVANKVVRPNDKILQQLCAKYDDLLMVDKITATTKKVEMVKLVMQENVEIALQNCMKLEALEQSAEELLQQAGIFHRNSKSLRDKMRWKNIRVKLAVACVFITIIGIIIGITVGVTMLNNKQ